MFCLQGQLLTERCGAYALWLDRCAHLSHWQPFAVPFVCWSGSFHFLLLRLRLRPRCAHCRRCTLIRYGPAIQQLRLHVSFLYTSTLRIHSTPAVSLCLCCVLCACVALCHVPHSRLSPAVTDKDNNRWEVPDIVTIPPLPPASAVHLHIHPLCD